MSRSMDRTRHASPRAPWRGLSAALVPPLIRAAGWTFLVLLLLSAASLARAAADSPAVPDSSEVPGGSPPPDRLPFPSLDPTAGLSWERGVVRIPTTGPYSQFSIRGHGPDGNSLRLWNGPVEDPFTRELSFTVPRTIANGISFALEPRLTDGDDPVLAPAVSPGGVVTLTVPDPRARTYLAMEAVSDNLAGGKFDQNVYTAEGGADLPTLRTQAFLACERRWFGDYSASPLTRDLPGHPDRLPANWLDGGSYRAMTRTKLRRTSTLSLRADGSRDSRQAYGQSYLYDAAHAPYREDEGRLLGLRLEDSSLTRVRSSLEVTHFRSRHFEGDGVLRRDHEAYRAGLNPGMDQSHLFWLPGHVYDEYVAREASYWQVHGAVGWEWGRFAGTAGGEYRHYDLRSYFDWAPTWGDADAVSRYGYDQEGRATGDGVRHPLTAGGFAQVRTAIGPAVLTAGLDVDHFTYETWPVVALGAPDLAPGMVREKQTHVGPRARVDWRANQAVAVGAAYSTHLEQPAWAETPGSFFRLSAPPVARELELGLAVERGRLRADATGVYRLGKAELGDREQSADRYEYRGGEFGLSYERGPVRLGAQYGFARQEYFGDLSHNIAWEEGQRRWEVRSPWEVRHSFAFQGDVRLDRLLAGARGRTPWAGTVLQARYRDQGGLPYTPLRTWDEFGVRHADPLPVSPPNSAWTGATATLDLAVEKRLVVRGVTLRPFVCVQNVLDVENPIRVYAGSGNTSDTGWLDTPAGSDWAGHLPTPDPETGLTGTESYQLRQRDPLNVGAPRQVFVGLRVEVGR